MREQRELFDKDDGMSHPTRVPMPVIYLSFAFLFAMLGFMVWMLWDFGIAGRVLLFLVLILVLVHFAVFMAKSLFDHYWPRR